MSDLIKDYSIGKLGFGFMRLPKKDGEFDKALIDAMVDKFLESGFTYFDTAYVYEGSEVAMRESLVKRHPRENYTIASKLNSFTVTSSDELIERFETTLERLGTDYVDFYLLHGMNGNSAKKYEALGSWEFLAEQKAKGRIRHIGFSYHGTASDLAEILTKHPETEFVQLQINYLDWESPKVDSRGVYETARRFNVPVVIMEPIKGGALASDDSAIAPMLKDANPDVSVASWALRFAASLDGVLVALSGMGSLEQMVDNVKTASSLTPMNDEELALLKKAVEVINAIPRIPCTGCEYCVKGCPSSIKIPNLMNTYSNYLVYNTTANVGHAYNMHTRGAGKASDCVGCKACEQICPQGIEITDILGKLAELFD